MKLKRLKEEKNNFEADEQTTKDKKKFKSGIVEYSHTMATIDFIKDDLKKLMLVFSVCSMAFFAVYYPYLIFKNVSSIPHLVAYPILFATAIISFVLEMVFKKKEEDTRKEQRKKVEKERFAGIFIKSFKYLAKGLTVALSISATIKNPNTDLSIILTGLSCVLLFVQILFEIIVALANRYIDYFKMALDMDMKAGKLTKLIFHKRIASDKLEEINYDVQGEEDYYTKQELKIRKKLDEAAREYKKETTEKRENRNKKNKAEIKEYKKQNREKLKADKIAEKEALEQKENDEKTEKANAVAVVDSQINPMEKPSRKPKRKLGKKEGKMAEALGDIIDLPDTVEN